MVVTLSFCAMQSPSIARAGVEPATLPLSFTAIHCEPHAATMLDWASLTQIVSYAQARNIKLTIQFTPPWVTLIQNQGLLSSLRAWETLGHEIGGHHHTLDHAASWDGYSNDPAAPTSPRPPGFQGGMQAYIDVLGQLAAPGNWIHTVSSKNADFPPGVPFQTGGDIVVAPPPPVSVPTLIVLNAQPVWNLSHAALIRGGVWFNAEMEADYLAATSEQVFGVAFHPNDYRPNPGPISAWFDFLAAQDPAGARSRTVTQILCPLPVRGDLNCDGLVDGLDIAPFVESVVAPSAYDANHPTCSYIHADMNCDGRATIADAEGFAGKLIGQ